MWRVMAGVSAGLMFALCALAGTASAEPAGQPAQPQCRKAEINPVTGHLLCLDPLGAPVEPPPPEAKLPCKKPEEARGQWSYGPNCTQEIEGM
jgi:hypothetical protein